MAPIEVIVSPGARPAVAGGPPHTMLHLGLDPSSKRLDVCVLDERGERIAVTAAPPKSLPSGPAHCFVVAVCLSATKFG